MDTLEYIGELHPGILNDLKKSAERTQLRQLRRLQQLTKQAEREKQKELKWQQIEERCEERARLRETELQTEALERAQKRELVEARRKCIQEQKERQLLEDHAYLEEKSVEAEKQAIRLAKQKKVLCEKDRAVSNLRQQRREIVKYQSDQLLEAKRLKMLTKQREIENKLAKRKQLRTYESKLQEYQKQLLEIQKRKDALHKAKIQEEERRLKLLVKQHNKDLSLEKMHKEKAATLLAKSKKSRNYENSVRSRLQKKQEEDELKRENKILALENKMARAEQIEKQRDFVRDALSSVRRAMRLQEEFVKKQLDELEQPDLNFYQTFNSSTLVSSLSSTSSRPKTSRGRLESGRKENSLLVPEFESLTSSRPRSALASTYTSSTLSGKMRSDSMRGYYGDLDLLDPNGQQEIDTQAKKLKDGIDEAIMAELNRRQQVQQIDNDQILEELEETFLKQRQQSMKKLENLRHEHFRNTLLAR